MFTKFKKPYKGVFKIIKLYWQVYGGWSALAFSPYFHVALLFTAIMSHFWLKDAWWDMSISILPSIIGFALGGYAIWLGFGDEKFRNLISEKDDSTKFSPYLEVSATFAHFIIIQLLALCLAILAKGLNFPLSEIPWLYQLVIYLKLSPCFTHEIMAPIFYGFGFLLFIYAILTAVAATLAVFRVANWFDTFRNIKKTDTPPSE